MKKYNIIVALLSFLAIIALGAVMRQLQAVFVPLLIALLISLMLAPLVRKLEKVRVPRSVGILIVMAAFFSLLYVVGQLFITSLRTFAQVFGNYQSRFLQIFGEIWERFDIPQEFFPQLRWTQGIIDRALVVSGGFVTGGTYLLLIILFIIFLLAENPQSWRKLRRAFPLRISNKVNWAIADITKKVARYLIVKSLISVVTGILVWLSLSLIGQDFALLWGLLAFLLNYIPNLGSFVILGATMTLGFVQLYPSWDRIVLVWVAMPTIQVLVGNILDPQLQGDQLDLSPFIILCSLLFWGWILGVVGMFLAVPLTVGIKIICAHVERLRPISVLMGSGRLPHSFRRHWRRGLRERKHNRDSSPGKEE